MLPYFQDLKWKQNWTKTTKEHFFFLNLCVVIKRRFSALYQGFNRDCGRIQGVMNHSDIHLGHDAPQNCSIRPLCNQTWESWVQPDHLVASSQQKPPVCWWRISQVVTYTSSSFIIVQPFGHVSNEQQLMMINDVDIYCLYHVVLPTDEQRTRLTQ